MKSLVVLHNRKLRVPVNCALGLYFNQQISPGNPSGSIVLKKENGDIIETFYPNDKEVAFNAHQLILNPKKNLPYETKIYLYVNDSAIISDVHGKSFPEISESGSLKYNFTTEDPIGKELDGGTIICKTNDDHYWVASPEQSELYCSWDERQKAVSLAEELTSTTGWVIPSHSEFRNPISFNLDKWHNHLEDDDKICDTYWTNTENNFSSAYSINISKNIPYINNKEYFKKVRSFKKVSYK
jgi:hypothetical protein